MIIDFLDKNHRYLKAHPLFAEAFEFILNTDLHSLPSGRNDIKGEQIFANRASYHLGDPELKHAESHLKYIDLHLIISGRETIEVSHMQQAVRFTDYESKDDFELFIVDGDPLHLTPNQFLILYPGEVHKTGIGKSDEQVEKVILKILHD
ncbi:YhcH/YjgK/YiaL family protein [Reinekea sp.]|jgi:YhcH/YjgK/YiaL family protein|uniref:YhcH/YjgK/YiaL family protein n=1 Tax=Reinekea sp. TaxID=1970455 RepID=UPI00398957C2